MVEKLVLMILIIFMFHFQAKNSEKFFYVQMYHASHLWNDMPNDFKDISTLPVFKGLLKKYVFTMF